MFDEANLGTDEQNDRRDRDVDLRENRAKLVLDDHVREIINREASAAKQNHGGHKTYVGRPLRSVA